MQTAVLFVDAGYLFGGGGDLLAGRVVPRRDLRLANAEGFIDKLLARVGAIWDGEPLRILRTYWYDGAVDGVPTPSQVSVGDLPRVKLRLGRINAGGQKGVDGLIILDLITLARNSAAGVAVLLSGDEDLRESVAHAQSFGVTVVVAGFPSSGRQRQSRLLLREADHVVTLDANDIVEHLLILSPPATADLVENVEPEVVGNVSTPPASESEESLIELCHAIVEDPRFSESGMQYDHNGVLRLSRHVDRVLIARLVELTGTFPLDNDLIRRARTMCLEFANVGSDPESVPNGETST